MTCPISACTSANVHSLVNEGLIKAVESHYGGRLNNRLHPTGGIRDTKLGLYYAHLCLRQGAGKQCPFPLRTLQAGFARDAALRGRKPLGKTIIRSEFLWDPMLRRTPLQLKGKNG